MASRRRKAEEAEVTEETPVVEVAPSPKVGKGSTRLLALAHIKRSAGAVEAGKEFEPADEKERKYLLGVGAAKEA